MANDTVEVTGKTVDDAVAAASAKLGIPADRLDYTVVTEGSKGILGIGAEDARIAVSMAPALAPGEVRSAEPAAVATLPAQAVSGEARPLNEERKGDNADLAMDLLEE